jgi:hypothetical protein
MIALHQYTSFNGLKRPALLSRMTIALTGDLVKEERAGVILSVGVPRTCACQTHLWRRRGGFPGKCESEVSSADVKRPSCGREIAPRLERKLETSRKIWLRQSVKMCKSSNDTYKKCGYR